jgi:hypothetical protein
MFLAGTPTAKQKLRNRKSFNFVCILCDIRVFNGKGSSEENLKLRVYTMFDRER